MNTLPVQKGINDPFFARVQEPCGSTSVNDKQPNMKVFSDFNTSHPLGMKFHESYRSYRDRASQGLMFQNISK